ncbi:MAG TPA: hypothetical protein VMN39_09800 [Longimicrobiaceae bacterium]|nr:hypothetical protein [Longimicrobiaceae bacterium]
MAETAGAALGHPRSGMRSGCRVRAAAWIAIAIAVCAVIAPIDAHSQRYAPESVAPASVTPVFDGWSRNPDGTFSLSFGYFSRSATDVIEIPLGPDNFIEPREFDGAQPTHFQPQPQDRGPGRGIRHWGVFTVTVPSDFGDARAVWTLRVGGETHAVPGHLTHPNYEIEALGVASSGVTPPALSFGENGSVGRGPRGIAAGPIMATVGVPLPIPVWARDETAPPVVLRWFKHQGPGEVIFERREIRVDPAAGVARAAATFTEVGEYVLRVRATNQATEFDRFCCWTNGYLSVHVGPGDVEPGPHSLPARPHEDR